MSCFKVATSEKMKGEVQQDEHSQPRQARLSAEGSRIMIKNEEKSVERRHLRTMGKVVHILLANKYVD